MAETRDTAKSLIDWKTWRPPLLHALPVTALGLCLFFYWFAFGDRYRVFLYHHHMGPLYPDTSPFSAVTSSRYWMAGLVASGAIQVLYAAVNWLVGRLVANYRSPPWWRVWVLCAPPLLIGIPLITMTVNEPTLPPSNAAQITFVTLIGLALALAPGRMAAERPRELVWLAFDGWVLMLVTLSAIGLEEMSRWLESGGTWRVRMMVLLIATGVVGLLVITGLRIWRRTSVPSSVAVFTAGLCIAYLSMPLVHHLIGTDGHFYISDSDNFFANNRLLQVAVWLTAAVLAVGVTWLRENVAAWRTAARISSA